MKDRKYCSHACFREGITKPKRECRDCKQVYDRKAFDWNLDPRRRMTSCQWCEAARARTRELGIGFMQPFSLAKAVAVRLAQQLKLPFQLNNLQLRSMYGAPCIFCGQPGCVFWRRFPEFGFDSGNTSIACWLCSWWSHNRKKYLAYDDVIAHARKVAAYHKDTEILPSQALR